MSKLIERLRDFRVGNNEKILTELIEFIKIPNNVFKPKQIQENAAVLKKMMERRGIATELWTTPQGRPLVYGELTSSRANKTVLIYGHYDGVPAEEPEWHSSPYDPVLRKDITAVDRAFTLEEALPIMDDSWRLFGRSSADSKNAILSILTALDFLASQGKEPSINLKFLFDGEEEVESPGLAECIKRNREKLACNLVISASGETHQSGLPTVELGVRGMLMFDIKVHTMASDLHSGHFGNFAPNAILQLAQLLNMLKGKDGFVSIPGFYEDVISLSELELEAIEKIPAIEDEIRRKYGIKASEIQGNSLQHLINLPTFNIRGIEGGFTGASARNIIPASANAEVDIRLVKGMQPEQIFNKIKKYIQEMNWMVTEKEPSKEELLNYGPIVQLNMKAGFPATKTDMASKEAEFVINALKSVCGEEIAVLPTEGGSLPLYLFEQNEQPVIGLPTSNYDCRQHTYDENLQLKYFFRAIEIFVSLFE